MQKRQESLPENSEKRSVVSTQVDFNPPDEWHWVEIEGEATVLPLSERSDPTNAASSEPLQLPTERIDSTVVASILNREVAVNPGGMVVLPVTLLNNGNRPARFRLQCDSDLDETWIDPLDQSMFLQPGEGTVMEITIRPPRTSAAVAGDYPLFLSVDASEYPGSHTQLAVPVTINPFRDLAVGNVQLQRSTVNALRRNVRLAVPIRNTGNVTTAVQVYGHEQGQRFHYRFASNGKEQPDALTLNLEPGQTTYVHTLVQPLHRAWVGTQPQSLRPALLFQIAEEARAPRAVAFSIYDLPFFGIWTLAGLAAAAMLLVMGLITAGVIAIGIWWVRQMPAQSQTIVHRTEGQPQPVVVVVPVNSLPLNKSAAQQPNTDSSSSLPLPTQEPQRNASTFGNQGAGALTAQLAQNGESANVPIITAADISQPGTQPAPALAPPSEPVAFQPAVGQPDPATNQSGMTYAQMFQEIALRYDLNWRMLAAQAYMESGFDSLALGRDGDMGLMQILPKTWQEFAPQLNVKDPFESYSNTLVAAAYLDYLRAKLGENGYPQQEWMLVAYNWGPDHVLDFLASGGKWEALAPERRQYAEEILRITKTIP